MTGSGLGGRCLWRSDVEQHVTEWREISERRAAVMADAINPERVIRELSPQLPADAQVAIDVGSVVY